MKRVLIDENLDWRLIGFLDVSFDTSTVQRKGWSGKKNGDLLRAAEAEFDVLVTADTSLHFQQAIAQHDLAIVLIKSRSSRLASLEPLFRALNNAIRTAKAGNRHHCWWLIRRPHRARPITPAFASTTVGIPGNDASPSGPPRMHGTEDSTRCGEGGTVHTRVSPPP